MAHRKLDRNDFKRIVRDIFQSAYYAGETDSYIIEQLKTKVYDVLGERTPSGKRRYTGADFSFILGYIDAKREVMWTQLEFVYRDKDGTIYSTHAESLHKTTKTLHDVGRGRELPNMEATHLWKHNGKLFGEWNVPNANRHG